VTDEYIEENVNVFYVSDEGIIIFLNKLGYDNVKINNIFYLMI
jgi:hypothetical protein